MARDGRARLRRANLGPLRILKLILQAMHVIHSLRNTRLRPVTGASGNAGGIWRIATRGPPRGRKHCGMQGQGCAERSREWQPVQPCRQVKSLALYILHLVCGMTCEVHTRNRSMRRWLEFKHRAMATAALAVDVLASQTVVDVCWDVVHTCSTGSSSTSQAQHYRRCGGRYRLGVRSRFEVRGGGDQHQAACMRMRSNQRLAGNDDRHHH